MLFRWFNHISAAAEAYKQRTKSNHDMTPIEDPSSVTIPTSSSKESPETEFVASSPTTISASSSNQTVEIAHNQSSNMDTDSNERKFNEMMLFFSLRKINLKKLYFSGDDHSTVNGSAIGKSSEDDAIDSKSNKLISGQYSNNSNNTRTLTQQSSLVAPSEVHISISPALTAEPVLTPNGE